MDYISIIEDLSYNDNLEERFKVIWTRIIDSIVSDNPDHMGIVIGDTKLGELCIKYLKDANFNEIVLYHAGDSPRHCQYSDIRKMGGFSSQAEVRNAMKRDSFLAIMV